MRDGFATAATLERDLEALLAAAPDCRLVAYCDLDTRLVLRHVAEPGVRQELLDRLSAEASDAFGLRAAACAMLPPGLSPLREETEGIRLIDDRGVRLFLRASDAPQDALILLCASSEGAEALRPAAARLLCGPTSPPQAGYA